MNTSPKLYIYEAPQLPQPAEKTDTEQPGRFWDFAVGFSCGLSISAAALYLYVLLRPL